MNKNIPILALLILVLLFMIWYLDKRILVNSTKIVCSDERSWFDYVKKARTGDIVLFSPGSYRHMTMSIGYKYSHMAMTIVLPGSDDGIDNKAVLHLCRGRNKYVITPLRLLLNNSYYDEYGIIPVREEVPIDKVKEFVVNNQNISFGDTTSLMFGYLDRHLTGNSFPDKFPEDFQCISFMDHLIKNVHDEPPIQYSYEPNRWSVKDIVDMKYREHLYDHDNFMVLCRNNENIHSNIQITKLNGKGWYEERAEETFNSFRDYMGLDFLIR